jgi:hypothetical protein
VDPLNAAARARLAWRLRHSGKACRSCGEVLPLGAFGRDSRNPDGLLSICNNCKSTANRAAYRRRKQPQDDD